MNKWIDKCIYKIYKVASLNDFTEEDRLESTIDVATGELVGLVIVVLGVLAFGIIKVDLIFSNLKGERWVILPLFGILMYVCVVIPINKYLKKKITLQKIERIKHEYQHIKMFPSLLFVIFSPLLELLFFVAILYVFRRVLI